MRRAGRYKDRYREEIEVRDINKKDRYGEGCSV